MRHPALQPVVQCMLGEPAGADPSPSSSNGTAQDSDQVMINNMKVSIALQYKFRHLLSR